MKLQDWASLIFALWGAGLSTYLAVVQFQRDARERRVQLRATAGMLLRAASATPERFTDAGTSWAASWSEEQVRTLEQLAAREGGKAAELTDSIADDLRWMSEELGKVNFDLPDNNFPWPVYQQRRRMLLEKLMILETKTGGTQRGWVSGWKPPR
jgi:hypothetical protein